MINKFEGECVIHINGDSYDNTMANVQLVDPKENLDRSVITWNDYFVYNPSTGDLIWKLDVSPRGRRGTQAGCDVKSGYRQIKLYGVHYREHRVIWELYHGEPIPEGMRIDHINRDRSDNRIFNLRLADAQTNGENIKGKGYYKRKSCNGYVAQIRVEGKTMYLGSYGTEAQAHAAYLEAKKKYHKGFVLIP